jgi:hypothetical protein
MSPRSTVVHEGTSPIFMRPLAEDEFTVLVDGVPVGRAVFSFGAANAVVERQGRTAEDTLWAVADAWFSKRSTRSDKPA